MKITSLVLSFTSKIKNHQHKLTGPLSTKEREISVNVRIMKIQKKMICGEATIRESLELQSSQSKDQLENLCYH